MQHPNNKDLNLLFDLATDIILISRQLISHAENAQWDEFAELDAKRQSLVRTIDLKDVDLTEEESVTFRGLMKEMIKLNDQLGALCINQRTELAKKLTEIQLGAKAKIAYT